MAILTVPGFHFTAFLECLDGKHRAGEAQCEGDQQGDLEIHAGEDRQAAQAYPEEHDTETHYHDQHVQCGAGPNDRFQQGAHIQLEADGEQQQGHAELAEFCELIVIDESEHVQHEARDQVTYQWRQADAYRQKPEDQGGSDPEQVVIHGRIVERRRRDFPDDQWDESR